MRRNGGLILLALGVFLVLMAPLLRFYIYPRVAVVPQKQDSETTLIGENATIFDTATLSEIHTTLTSKARTIGDDEAAKDAPDGTVVWQTATSTTDSDGVVRSQSIQRQAFDDRSAEGVDCCDTFSSTTEGQKDPVTYSGLLVKFPFDTQKKDYEWWDDDLGKPAPIKYEGAEKVKGLTVYKFVQTIDPVVTDTIEAPASVLGLSQQGNVQADQVYSNTRTLWVEPRTGVVIIREEKQHNTLQYQGEDKVTTTDVTTKYDDKTVQKNVDDYSALSTQLYILQTLGPILALVIGLLSLLAGALLALRSPKRSEA